MGSPVQYVRKLAYRMRGIVPKPVKVGLRRCQRFTRDHFIVPTRRLTGRDIPIAMITGTKGKTTTTRMLAHILHEAGHTVGFTSTDGIVIDGNYLNHKDSAGYHGAGTVLRDPTVTAAVLEAARGDLLKAGLYVDRCNVAAFLNVGLEQIGIDGVDTVEKMAQVKSIVTDTARDAVILNAEDPLVVQYAGKYASTCPVYLFAMDPDNEFVVSHLEAGGTAFVVADSTEGERIELRQGEDITPISSVMDIPSSAKGIFRQNIANALATAALAHGMKIPLETIRRGLEGFELSLEHSPGRLNFIEGYTQTILLEHAATVPSCTALVDSLSRLEREGDRVCVYVTSGRRPDWHYDELGRILGPHFDRFVCYELGQYRSTREPMEVPERLEAGLVKSGVDPSRIRKTQEYEGAVETLLEVVGRDDLVVIIVGSSHTFMPLFRDRFAQHEK